jgi:hypothetical protein
MACWAGPCCLWPAGQALAAYGLLGRPRLPLDRLFYFSFFVSPYAIRTYDFGLLALSQKLSVQWGKLVSGFWFS